MHHCKGTRSRIRDRVVSDLIVRHLAGAIRQAVVAGVGTRAIIAAAPNVGPRSKAAILQVIRTAKE